MRKVEFTKLTTYEKLEKEGPYRVCDDNQKDSKYFKGRICIVFADVFGIPHIEDITKLIRKYTCGQLISRTMAQNLSKSFEQMEFFLVEGEEGGYILELEKSIKQASRENGYT